MAYVTRCPYCGAVWLLPSKDAAEQAPAKCSACQKCFDATRDMLNVPDALFPEIKPALEVTPAPLVATTPTPASQPAEPEPLSTPEESALMRIEEEETAIEQAAPSSVSPTETTVASDLSDETKKKLEKLNTLMSDFSGRTEPTVGISTSAALPDTQKAPEMPKNDESEKLSPKEIPSAIHTKKHKASAVGSVIVCILAFVILVIAGIAFNQPISEKIPSTKPLFESICTKITCPGFYLKNIEAFAIAKAQLTNSGTPGNYNLEVTILNGSTTAQAVPHLSLQLVDENDTEITRQILSPADFLADPSVKSLGAGRSLTINVNMRTNTTPSRCIATPVYP